MKKLFFATFLCVAGLLAGCQQKKQVKKEVCEPQHYVVAYVTSGSKIIPDARFVTHINYAFGVVNSTFNGITIQNEERLRTLAALKENAPHLKVLLSVGGWGCGGFSEMAANEEFRLAFAKDCKRVMDEFKIDGIDLDWEYPTDDSAGIGASPEDTQNFTLLMRDIRHEIGPDALLTFASIASAIYVDFKGVLPYIDFVNIMTYDLNKPPYHNAALYRSELGGRLTCDEAVKAHIQQGMPADKLMLGVPFYGHGKEPVLTNFVDFSEVANLTQFTTRWDSIACVPYLVDENGEMVLTYDNPASIALKCKYVKEMKLKGIMYWHYSADDEEGSLRQTVLENLQ